MKTGNRDIHQGQVMVMVLSLLKLKPFSEDEIDSFGHGNVC